MRRYVVNFNLDALGVQPGDTIIDVGCGEGLFARELVQAGFDVTGVEPEAYLRDRFEQWAEQTGPGHGRVIDGTAERIPLPDASAKAIVITEVLEHVKDPAPCLTELFRVTKPGGMLCVSVPTSFSERIYWGLHPGYERNSTHLRIFTKPALARAIEQAGFEIVHWEGRNHEAAMEWVWHALFRSTSDHAGRITSNGWITRLSRAFWGTADRLRLHGPFVRVGNKLFPKSWYVYCRRSE